MSGWSNQKEIKQSVPTSLLPWLEYSESMTARMKSRSTTYSIAVLEEGWRVPEPDVQNKLALSPDELIWLRGVQITCDEKPVMLAKSFFPKPFLNQFEEGITSLGENSLGEILFTQPDLTRSDFEFGYFSMWARQSVLNITSKAFLLREFFIPSDMYGHDYL